MSIFAPAVSPRQLLLHRFADRMKTADFINRKSVSFQDNKHLPGYRWFKYKEAFSSGLVQTLLGNHYLRPGRLLDPFAGTGTALFAGRELGWKTTGIELLPVGLFIAKARAAACHVTSSQLRRTANRILSRIHATERKASFFHIPITNGAFPVETERRLNRFLALCRSIRDPNMQTLVRFAGMAVLEEISYTRKDGASLRWDHRCERILPGKPFNKGPIPSFEEAFMAKIDTIIADLHATEHREPIRMIEGSCLELMPQMDAGSFECVLTSPPYCNRYDYTRIYALELVYLGKSDDDIRQLRQAMLSCTVENKEKVVRMEQHYHSIGRTKNFRKVVDLFHHSPVIDELDDILTRLNSRNLLNNRNIPRLVRNYLFEMALVIAEMARLLRRGGYCIMVNDNVQYGGQEIPVDLILSDFAEQLGFRVQRIFVLPKGKGNSSQQMGQYGRTEIRKCVYLWQKA